MIAIKYTVTNLGEALHEKLHEGMSVLEISQWAHGLYLNERFQDPAIDDYLMDLIVMEEGPEFEMTIEELYKFAEKLKKTPPFATDR